MVLKEADTGDWRLVEETGEFEEVVKKHVREMYAAPASLGVPPARAKLVRAGGQDALLLSLHHATYGERSFIESSSSFVDHRCRRMDRAPPRFRSHGSLPQRSSPLQCRL